jgi:PKD repeat protein
MTFDRISSLDAAYRTGDLSIYPEAVDNKFTLFQATNNSHIRLKQSLSFNSKIIIVEDTSGFPDNGLLRVGSEIGTGGQYELIAYEKKTSNTFQNLKRGFAGSRSGHWLAKAHWVSNVVSSQHHNAVKDAIINIEQNLGLKENPEENSLNGILKAQEVRFLAPKPIFRAFPIKGSGPLNVRFQNFSSGDIARFLWDFGDGGTSLERSPIHTYLTEGVYTVKLNVITITGAQGIVTKTNYIVVDSNESVPFFYVDSVDNPYSIETANNLSVTPKTFRFVDQSDGKIVQRNWIFGDGTSFTEEDQDIHEINHVYSKPGEYIVTELIQFSNGRLKRVQLPEPLVVL